MFSTVENSAGRDFPAAAESRKIRLRDGFGSCGGGGAFLVERQRGGRGGLRGGLLGDGLPVPR